MKIFFPLLLSLSSFICLGQQKFSIKLNQKTIGSASISQSKEDFIFTSLISNICLITLVDTTNVSSNLLFKENITGQLLEVKNQFTDSKEDPFTKTYTNTEDSVLGPFGIQQKSISTLKLVGDTTSFYNYSADLNKVIKTHRKILSQEFINARKIWMTIDSTTQLPVTFNKFDRDFELYSSLTTTGLGKISLLTMLIPYLRYTKNNYILNQSFPM